MRPSREAAWITSQHYGNPALISSLDRREAPAQSMNASHRNHSDSTHFKFEPNRKDPESSPTNPARHESSGRLSNSEKPPSAANQNVTAVSHSGVVNLDLPFADWVHEHKLTGWFPAQCSPQDQPTYWPAECGHPVGATGRRTRRITQR